MDSFKHNFGDSFSTQFNLSVEYSDFEDTIDYGIPAIGNRPAPVPIENFYGVADDWAIKHKFAWYLRDREYIDSGPQAVRVEEGLVDIFASFPYGDKYEAYFTELDLTGRFDLLSMTHSVLFGAEYYKERTNSPSSRPTPTQRPFSILMGSFPFGRSI
ncbi:MAG: hypothetical protein ACREVJ_02550 [Gammaproteobacteria bacterium]